MMRPIEYSIQSTPLPNDKIAIDLGVKTQFEVTHKNEIVIMIDLSRSMSSSCSPSTTETITSRRTAAINSTEKLLAKLDDETNIRIIGFDHTAETIYTGKKKDAVISDIKKKLYSGFEGSTDFLQAIESIVNPHGLEQSILLLTDGHDTRGNTVETIKEAVNKLAQGNNKKSAPIIAIGIGEEYDDSFLRALTDNKVFATNSAETLPHFFTSLLPHLQGTVTCAFSVTINQEHPTQWDCNLLSNHTNYQTFTIDPRINGNTITATITQHTNQTSEVSSKTFTLTQEDYMQPDAKLLSVIAQKETSAIFIDYDKPKQEKADELSYWLGFLVSTSNQSEENKQPLMSCIDQTRNLLLRTLNSNVHNDQSMMTGVTSLATNTDRLMTQTTATGCVTQVAGHYQLSNFDELTEDFKCPILIQRIAGKVINLPGSNGKAQYFSLAAIKGHYAATGYAETFPHPLTRELISKTVLDGSSAILESTHRYQRELIDTLLSNSHLKSKFDIQRYIQSVSQFLSTIGWLDKSTVPTQQEKFIREKLNQARQQMIEALNGPSGREPSDEITVPQHKERPPQLNQRMKEAPNGPSVSKRSDEITAPRQVKENQDNNGQLNKALEKLNEQITSLQARGFNIEKNILSSVKRRSNISEIEKQTLEKHRGYAPLCVGILQTLTVIGFVLGLVNLAINNQYTFRFFIPNTKSINAANAVLTAKNANSM